MINSKLLPCSSPTFDYNTIVICHCTMTVAMLRNRILNHVCSYSYLIIIYTMIRKLLNASNY